MFGNLQTPLFLLFVLISFVKGQNSSPSDVKLARLCDKRLLYAIKYQCDKLRNGTLDIVESSARYSSPQKRNRNQVMFGYNEEGFSEAENSDQEYEGEMGDEPQADEAGSRSMGIVRDCCHNRCTLADLQAYCKRFKPRRARNGVEQAREVDNISQNKGIQNDETFTTCKPCNCRSESSGTKKVPRAVVVRISVNDEKETGPIFGQPTFPGNINPKMETPYPTAITDAPFYPTRNPNSRNYGNYWKK